jgi:ferritin-like metal-binding protein YciE
MNEGGGANARCTSTISKARCGFMTPFDPLTRRRVLVCRFILADVENDQRRLRIRYFRIRVSGDVPVTRGCELRGAWGVSGHMSTISSPRDLLVEEIKDLYSAENQLIKALPKMAKAAMSEELRAAFETHLKETEEHAVRLEKIAKQIGESAKGKKCKGMEGLVEEAKEMMAEDAEPMLLDLALIGAAQKAEHYEIAGYGTARTLAEIAGEEEVARTLQVTLDEEGKTDKLLTEIALELNLEAAATDAEDQ